MKDEKMKTQKRDLLRIGIFSLGISAIVFAGIALHWYYQIQTEEKPWKSSILPFLVRCEETEEAMIIEAKQDLTNVSIKDKEENVICSFNKIKAGSQLSASLWCSRTRTTGGYVALTEPKSRKAKLHISPER